MTAPICTTNPFAVVLFVENLEGNIKFNVKYIKNVRQMNTNFNCLIRTTCREPNSVVIVLYVVNYILMISMNRVCVEHLRYLSVFDWKKQEKYKKTLIYRKWRLINLQSFVLSIFLTSRTKMVHFSPFCLFMQFGADDNFQKKSLDIYFP